MDFGEAFAKSWREFLENPVDSSLTVIVFFVAMTALAARGMRRRAD